MPIYMFKCDDCGEIFEKKMPMSLSHTKPKCVMCNKNNVNRDFQSESHVVIFPPKTVGSLADKNTSGMSDETRKQLQVANRNRNRDRTLPGDNKRYEP